MRHMRPMRDDVPDSTSHPRALGDVFTIPGFLEDSQQFDPQVKLEI